jgi:hypothetical protein
MAQVPDDWTKVESRLAEIDELRSWRPTVAGIRGLVAAIRSDGRFHDIEPSLSLTALVFRRRDPRAVMASWNDDGTYGIAYVDYPFEISGGERFEKKDMKRALDALQRYLVEALLSREPS